jgi:hypothetical protein
MKSLYGTSFPAPENQKRDLSFPAAAAILAARRPVRIARLTERHTRNIAVHRAVEVLPWIDGPS